MKTCITGGWVVAFRNGGHEVFEGGEVVYENGAVVHAGGAYAGPVDERIDATGMLVAPGFINTHVHTSGNGGDTMLMDMLKNDYRTTNYMSFAAPIKGRQVPPAGEDMAAIRRFVLLHAMKGGATTIIDVGGLRGDWERYAELIESLGARVYAGPSFRERNTFTDPQGRIYYDSDTEAGRKGLAAAVDYIRAFNGAAGGRLRGMLNPAQVETCGEALLRDTKAAARELNVPVHTHAGGNLLEFAEILREQRRTPIQYLADIGFLDARTLIGHGVFTTAHPWSHYPFGDDLRVLAETGATVGHCPYKYAKMAIVLRSFQRYLEAGVTLALGTDTFPMDMVSELRWAGILAKVADENYQAGQPRDTFNAATLGGCVFLGRDDLGRLAPGARADIILVRLDHLHSAPYRDPIKALVDFGSGRDVDTAIVEGRTVIAGGHAVALDEAQVYAHARDAIGRFWQHVPDWHWAGATVDQVIPPAYPLHRRGD
ncbi:MAG: amidohydrolase family protein [Candidatus Lambdaproteobacteria bacterium]|nr:amidohydrolase family protein [Candidatus Lambdaproteobacteria bacterium]